jgi:hypothetical protein
MESFPRAEYSMATSLPVSIHHNSSGATHPRRPSLSSLLDLGRSISGRVVRNSRIEGDLERVGG